MASKLNALDLAFLSLEKRTTPVNVAFLSVLSIPDDYEGNYTLDLVKELEAQAPTAPFNQKLSSTKLSSFPSWIEDEHFDIHYHVRHSALPKPGTLQDLTELVSRLHNRLLDRDRPLWEFHLIEGLENNRFAIYLKMHHACIDGMGGVAVVENSLTASPTEEVKAPWCAFKKQNKKKKQESNTKKTNLGDRAKLVKELSGLLLNQGLKIARLKDNTAPATFTAPKSIFNVPITGARRFAVKSMSLSEIKAIAHQAEVTVNDIVLALCAGAIRKYLLEKDALPKKPMMATIPVSVRQLHRSGNQITYVSANLATNEPDSMTRLRKISQSTSIAKAEIQDLASDAATSFAVIAQGLVAVMNQLNITDMVPPPSNVAISNIPGPKEPLYFGRAKLEANYPVSMLIDGQSLNMTVVSYCDNIDFGLMACRDTIPDINYLAELIEDAFDGIKGGLFLNNLMEKRKATDKVT